MTKQRGSTLAVAVCLLGAVGSLAQQPSVVPRLIKFSGEINPQIKQINESEDGKNQSLIVVRVIFSLYELQQGGSPLWSE